MRFRRVVLGLSYVCGIGLLATGCIREPQALVDLQQARDAITTAKQSDAAKRSPDTIMTLEQRYLEARGTFYACQDDKASDLAKALIDDANRLASQRTPAPERTPPSPPPNRPPRAVFTAPSEGEVNVLLRVNASQSSDPDRDPLTYIWDYGDGSSYRFTFPIATHRYQKPGRYTIALKVDDGKGGTDQTSAPLDVIQRVVIHDLPGLVLFDFDKSTLKPKAREVLRSVVQLMQDDPLLRAEVVGHADWMGTEAYNMRLSNRRANAVKRFMVKQGIPADYIRLDWKGESQPMASNTTREGRAQNRRAVITLRPLQVQ